MPEWPCGATWSARPTSGVRRFPLCAPVSRATARAPTAPGLVWRFPNAGRRRDNRSAARRKKQRRKPGRPIHRRRRKRSREGTSPAGLHRLRDRLLRPCRRPASRRSRDRRSTDGCQEFAHRKDEHIDGGYREQRPRRKRWSGCSRGGTMSCPRPVTSSWPPRIFRLWPKGRWRTWKSVMRCTLPARRGREKRRWLFTWRPNWAARSLSFTGMTSLAARTWSARTPATGSPSWSTTTSIPC